jgi:hypothetical protein
VISLAGGAVQKGGICFEPLRLAIRQQGSIVIRLGAGQDWFLFTTVTLALPSFSKGRTDATLSAKAPADRKMTVNTAIAPPYFISSISH